MTGRAVSFCLQAQLCQAFVCGGRAINWLCEEQILHGSVAQQTCPGRHGVGKEWLKA